MKQIYHFLYASSASGHITPKMLDSILEVSIKKNGQSNVSGLLLYRVGQFIHLLEGQKEDVLSVYKRVQKDNRHSDIKILTEFHTGSRLFGNWNMGYVRDEEAAFDIVKKLKNVLETPISKSDNVKRDVIAFLSNINSKDIK